MNVTFFTPAIKPIAVKSQQISFQGPALKPQPEKDCVEFKSVIEPPAFTVIDTLTADEPITATRTLAANDNSAISKPEKTKTKKLKTKIKDYPFSVNLMNELTRTTCKTNWKTPRKGSTKLSEARVYEHPEHGKIKLTVTIEPGKGQNISYRDLNPMMLIFEVPQYDIKYTLSSGDNALTALAKVAIGPENIERLQQRRQKESALSLKRYEKMLDEFGLREPKRKNRNEIKETCEDELDDIYSNNMFL